MTESPTAPRRFRLVAGVVASGLLVCACTATPSALRPSSATATTGAAPAPATSTTTTTLPVAPVRWTPCGDLQCGVVVAPLDYADPGGPTIRIAVARHPAEDPAERIGSLVINPGGPGGSGIDDLPTELDVLGPAVLARFDVVSFDPRGVERTAPVTCQPTTASAPSTPATAATTPPVTLPRPSIDPVPTTAAARAALVANDVAFAHQCQEADRAELPYVGTVDTARDLDRIRQALGDARLTYVGHSYGTLLGATYAGLFPTHVRAMVLDGAIDPSLSSTAYADEQADSLEDGFLAFATWCHASAACAWRTGPDATQTFLALAAAGRVRPFAVDGGGAVGVGQLYDALLDGLGSPSSWPTLGEALARATAGDGTGLAAMTDRYETGGSPDAADAEQAIDCLDHPVDRRVADYPALAADSATRDPIFGPLLTWGLLGCATWPALPTRTPAPADDAGAPPILVVGTSHDPVTPFAWSVALAHQLTGAVLLTWDGRSHVATFSSPCVRADESAYLVTGALPAPGTTCTD